MMERRLESRFLCADLVRVDWSAGVKARTAEAVLEDISAVGACVQVEERIRPGTTISIAMEQGPDKSAKLSGEVSYCVFRDYGYFVGICFSDETRWSSGTFKPRHLTNLQTLLAT